MRLDEFPLAARRAWMDWCIGWHAGGAQRHEARAQKHRRRETKWRNRYREAAA